MNKGVDTIPRRLKKSTYDKKTCKHRPNAHTRKAQKAKRVNSRKHKFGGMLRASRDSKRR
jgi:hypothetical protein